MLVTNLGDGFWRYHINFGIESEFFGHQGPTIKKPFDVLRDSGVRKNEF